MIFRVNRPPEAVVFHEHSPTIFKSIHPFFRIVHPPPIAFELCQPVLEEEPAAELSGEPGVNLVKMVNLNLESEEVAIRIEIVTSSFQGMVDGSISGVGSGDPEGGSHGLAVVGVHRILKQARLVGAVGIEPTNLSLSPYDSIGLSSLIHWKRPRKALGPTG